MQVPAFSPAPPEYDQGQQAAFLRTLTQFLSALSSAEAQDANKADMDEVLEWLA